MELCINVPLFDVLTILIHHFVLFYSILSQKEKTENNTQSSCMVFFFVFYVGWAYILRGSLFIKVVSQWIQATRNLLQCYPIFGLKVVPTTSLLLCFLRLKESTCETSKNVFYFTSKTLFILVIIKFWFFRYSNIMTSANAQAWNTKHILLNNLGSKDILVMKFGQFM